MYRRGQGERHPSVTTPEMTCDHLLHQPLHQPIERAHTECTQAHSDLQPPQGLMLHSWFVPSVPSVLGFVLESVPSEQTLSHVSFNTSTCLAVSSVRTSSVLKYTGRTQEQPSTTTACALGKLLSPALQPCTHSAISTAKNFSLYILYLLVNSTFRL